MYRKPDIFGLFAMVLLSVVKASCFDAASVSPAARRNRSKTKQCINYLSDINNHNTFISQYFRQCSFHELFFYPVNSSYSVITLFLTVNRFIYFYYIFFFYLCIYSFIYFLISLSITLSVCSPLNKIICCIHFSPCSLKFHTVFNLMISLDFKMKIKTG